jgi:Putative amidoligase enzyme
MPSNNRPSTYNRSNGINRTRTATHVRQDEALRLREGGMSYIDIARRLGWTPNGVPRPQSASEACRAARLRREAGNPVAIANTAVRTVANRMSNRTYGVEIEFFNITPNKALTALTAVGILTAVEGYNHHTRPHWKITTDASVTSRGTGLGQGLELVSPILQGEAGLEITAKAVKALLDAGAKVDKTCGLHVHVGADGMTGADILRVIDIYTANGSHIDSVLAQSRHNTRWAKKYTQAHRSYNAQRIRNLATAIDTASITEAINRLSVDRYQTVNLASYLRHGTVEFRQHQGTLNGEKIATWVRLVLSIIEKAIVTDDASAQTDLGSLDAFMTNLGLADETKQFLNRRASTLALSR